MNQEISGCRFVVRFVMLAACLVVSWSAQGQQPEPSATAKTEAPVATDDSRKTPMAPVSNDEDRYRIGPGDVLDIRILNRPNLSREAVRVEGNGVIRMPLIDDEIQAACKTEGELSREIAEKYTKFYRKPQVDVFIKEYHSRQVAVIGAVNEQSRFELQRRVRLLELLSYAKGTAPKAGQTINVVHSPRAYACQKGEVPGEATGFSSYKLSDTLLGDPRANPYIEPGDIVTVPEANLIYVVGNVYTPLTIPLKEPITLSRAVAMAGGVKQDSKKDQVRIVRQETATGTSREILVDLTAIEKKRAEDVALLPNDIIDVPTSGSKAFLRSLLGTVAPSLTQLPVRVIP
ncbi:MAG TPA: polysaccharide biosynthesis/export family protein [Pyrinomonadaceae bacterium]|nr:polysaccharide biosynthesis/export family protein [Pyrinomonadaceae bacterium]